MSKPKWLEFRGVDKVKLALQQRVNWLLQNHSVDKLDDVTLTNIADGQILKYDSATSKFVNADESGGGGSVTPSITKVYDSNTSGSSSYTVLKDGLYLIINSYSYDATHSVTLSRTPIISGYIGSDRGMTWDIVNLKKDDVVTMVNTPSSWDAFGKVIYLLENITVDSLSDSEGVDDGTATLTPPSGNYLMVGVAMGRTSNDYSNNTDTTGFNGIKLEDEIGVNTSIGVYYGDDIPEGNFYGYDGGGGYIALFLARNNGGGSGTNVVANPTGTPIDTLTTIGIDGTRTTYYTENSQICSVNGNYVTSNLDTQLVNGGYKIHITDGAYEFDNNFTYSGSTVILELSANGETYIIEITSTTVGMTYGSGAWRDIYCDIYTEESGQVIYDLGTSADKISYDNTTSGLSADNVQEAIDEVQSNVEDMIPLTQKGANGGVAELDSNGKVPSSQLPSYVDDVIEGYYNSNTDRFYKESTFITVIPPEDGKSWVDVTTNKSYRWTGSVYTRVDEGVQLGETSSTAYRGDRGKTAYEHSQMTSGNPHNVSKSDVGLGNVPNVSTNDQTPTFTQANTRANIASGEKLSVILGKIMKWFTDLKTVAFTNSYTDLDNKPTIPTVNNATLNIKKNGTSQGTFTANASTDVNVNISVPTKTSDLANDSNYVSDASYVHTDNNFTSTLKTKLDGIESQANKTVVDSALSTSSTNPLQNKVVTSNIKAINTNGAKNLLPLSLEWIKANNVSGTWNGNTYTLNNITFTINVNGNNNILSISTSGTASAGTSLNLYSGEVIENAILSGCPSGGSSSKYSLNGQQRQSPWTNKADFGEGVSLTGFTYNIILIYLGVANGTNINGLTFKPMIRLAGDTDNTFQPYAKTNLELTNQVDSGVVNSANKLSTARTIALDGDVIGNISFDGSSNVSMQANLRYKSCGSNNVSNYPYHRIARVLNITSTYQDRDAILIIRKHYNGGALGIVKVSYRTNAGGAETQASAQWLIRIGFDVSDLVIADWGISNTNSCYCDVFLKCGTYTRTYVTELQGNFDLIQSNEVYNTTSTDKKDSYEVYKNISTAGQEIHGQAYTHINNSVDNGVAKYANELTSYGTITSGNTQAVTGGAVYDKLSGISTGISGMTFQKAGKIVEIDTYGVSYSSLHSATIPNKFKPHITMGYLSIAGYIRRASDSKCQVAFLTYDYFPSDKLDVFIIDSNGEMTSPSNNDEVFITGTYFTDNLDY